MSGKISADERQALISLSAEYKKYKEAMNLAMENLLAKLLLLLRGFGSSLEVSLSDEDCSEIGFFDLFYEKMGYDYRGLDFALNRLFWLSDSLVTVCPNTNL